jgi:N-acetylglucosamine-6-phosphate deacetylase
VRLEGDVLRGRAVAPGSVAIADGLIAARGGGRRVAPPPGWTICGGFVDLQVNGFGGAEVGGDADELAQVAAALPAVGVTAFCPTLVSRDDGGYARAARALASAAGGPASARMLGPHLEGPFLAPTRHGAHDPALLRAPDPASVDRLVDAFRPAIVTLAPELPGALAAIRRIRRGGAVAAVGHTEADAATGRAAIAAGAGLLTHAFNAMRGIASREPSALAAFLAHPRARISLIGDGVHVAPEVAVAAARATGRRLVLVSDAAAAAGAPPGTYRLGGLAITSDGVRASAGGRLAGSALGLDRGPATLAEAGLARGAALSAAIDAPRRLLGLAPALATGSPADVVVLDPDLVPRLTLVGGRVAFADPDLPFEV